MGAPLNNQNAAGHGRPRQLDREINRLDEAAQHARRILESQQLELLLLGDGDPEIAAIRQRRIEEGCLAVVKIERQLDTLRWLAQEVLDLVPAEALRLRRQRGARPLGASDHEQAVMQAARWLDRVLPEDQEAN